MSKTALADAARAVLAQNDRGEYSIPTGGLYPMQFNWDSAFAALGYAYCDRGGDSSADRPWREIELLIDAQWDSGMIPHIVFRGDYLGYFPGPAIWQAPTDGAALPTSGITNPPVAAYAASVLHQRRPLHDAQRYQRILNGLATWHRWIADTCLDAQTGAFAAVHPWETGRDNACDWDAAMARITPRRHPPYTRSDTRLVAAEERPSQDDYDRFLEIVAVGRDCGWSSDSDDGFRARSPFRMFDPGITAILAFANDCLVALLDDAGMNTARARIADIGDTARRGLAFLWNDTADGYTAYNPQTKQHCDGLSSASFLAPLAGLCAADDVEKERHQRLMRQFDRIADAAPYLMPSHDPAHGSFQPRRYWRGPAWLPVNLLIAEGLRRCGELARAERIESASLQLVEQSGFHEYFDPVNGDGLGGAPFTWTAASVLHFLQRAQ